VLDIQVNQKIRWQSKCYSKANITNRHHLCFILCHFQGKTFINSELFIDVLTQIMC